MKCPDCDEKMDERSPKKYRCPICRTLFEWLPVVNKLKRIG